MMTSLSDTNLVLLKRLKHLRVQKVEQPVRSQSFHDTSQKPQSFKRSSSLQSLHVFEVRVNKETLSENYVSRLKSLMEKKRVKSSNFNSEVDSSIFIFNPPDWKWQKNKSNEFNLPIEQILWNRQAPWHLFTVDTPPKTCQSVSGDGNCLFRALSFWITGSEEHHLNIRSEIIRESIHNAATYKSLISTSVEEYLRDTNMQQEGVWGTEVEIFVAASLLKTPVMVHAAYGERHLWQKFKPLKMQPPTAQQLRRYHGPQVRNTSLPTESTTTIYLHNSSNHFEPVIDI